MLNHDGLTQDFMTDMSIPTEPDLNEEYGFVTSHNSSLMAICTDGNRCGGAVYNGASVRLLADRRDSGDPYKGLDIIIQRVDPEVVIVSSVQKKLIAFLEKRFNYKVLDISRKDKIVRSDDQLETNTATFLLAIVPNTWFSMSKGLQKLIDSELVKSKGYQELDEKILFVTSKVEKSLDVCAIRSISALDQYILHNSIKEPDSNQELAIAAVTQASLSSMARPSSLEQNNQTLNNEVIPYQINSMPVLEIAYIDPGPVLSIDRFTFESLGIFKRHKKKESSLEELDHDPDILVMPSLFELLNQCHSPQGKRQLRSMMLWPLQEMVEIQNRHDTLEFFMIPENRLLKDQLAVQLKNVVPLATLLTKLNHSVGTYKELSTLYKSLWSFMAIIDLIKANVEHDLEIFRRITQLDSSDLRAVIDSIINVVDFEASKKEKRVQVCFGVDEIVDEKKEIIKNLTKFCDEVAIEETAKYKDSIAKQFNVIYIPRIGFLDCIDYSTTTELMMMRTNKQFDVLLHTEQSVYFKTPRMEQLDNNAGDIACDLIDVQEKVIVSLQTSLLKFSEVILRLMELCGDLDCLMSFASISFQRGFTRPEFVPSIEGIEIKQAYHPLHSLKCNMVSNDIRFYNTGAERRVKVMLLSGPNSCGKTTYMKTTCLIIYMAHIGCFVPAISARIPIIDAILTRMHSANSISTGLSSFATDVHQITYALNRATEKSFIAIDEFGKGTQARDGFHLLKGLITYFATRTSKSPFVIAATHFSRLIDHLQNYSEYLLYKTFKVSRSGTSDNVVYEFQLIDGVGEISLADKVAARAGIPQRVINRAQQVRDHIIDGTMIRPRPPSGA